MSRSDATPLSGILVIDKPAGLTSHDVVARVRRLVGMRRVGHGGTLDPFATGVLPIAVGQATRVLPYVQASQKVYLAHAVLGCETDSGDIDGAVVACVTVADWPTLDQVRDVLDEHTGTISQTPPALSAIKVAGQPLHRRVRAGEEVVVPARDVVVHSIEVVAYEPPNLHLRISCGSGTYVRSLVRDIGRSLGTRAYCHALRRERAGPFELAGSHTLEDLAGRDVRAEWEYLAVGMDAAVAHLPPLRLSEEESRRWYHGRSLPILALRGQNGPGVMRVYDSAGRFAGIGVIDDGLLVPRLVVPPATEVGGA